MPDEIKKSQWIRLVDVFALGPFMVYIGVKESNLNEMERWGIILAGIGTIVYNGRNYLANLQNKQNIP